jgi:hypothetical protein
MTAAPRKRNRSHHRPPRSAASFLRVSPASSCTQVLTARRWILSVPPLTLRVSSLLPGGRDGEAPDIGTRTSHPQETPRAAASGVAGSPDRGALRAAVGARLPQIVLAAPGRCRGHARRPAGHGPRRGTPPRGGLSAGGAAAGRAGPARSQTLRGADGRAAAARRVPQGPGGRRGRGPGRRRAGGRAGRQTVRGAVQVLHPPAGAGWCARLRRCPARRVVPGPSRGAGDLALPERAGG